MVWMRAAPSPWGRTSQQLAPDDREQYDERGRDALRQGPKAGHQTTHHRSGRATLQTRRHRRRRRGRRDVRLPVGRAARRDRPPPRRHQANLHRRTDGRDRRHRGAPRPDGRRGCSNRRAHALRNDDRHPAARQDTDRPRPIRPTPRPRRGDRHEAARRPAISASQHTVADARRLGAQALTDDRLDRALLLARTGVELDDSVATRGNLLATLMRVRPGSLGVLPDVRDVEIYTVEVDPRGARLAFGDAFGELQLWDIATRRKLVSHRMEDALVQRVAFSPDGRTLAVTWLQTTTGSTQLELFDAGSLRPRRRVTMPGLPEPTEFVGTSPAFTADGNIVVVEIPFPHNQPEAVRLIDARTGAVADRAFRLDAAAWDMAMTADRRRVLVTSDREDATYELDAADLRVVERHPAGGVALALSPDDRTLALADANGGMRLLDRRTSRERSLAGRPGRVSRMTFTPDGATLVGVADRGRLIVWDVRP